MVEKDEPVGVMIRRVRILLGYSQYEIADLLVEISGNWSLTREEVSRWERGKRIPGPYWRGWISEVLRLPRGDVDAAAHIARNARKDVAAAGQVVAPQVPLWAQPSGLSTALKCRSVSAWSTIR
ncbi:helix-turn-helix domain-containing protein [Phytoactinopolyspora endophytica]|uniref:helix-turn-helix domain-containing protein n=1 Tax=Phytoactinopolyspora endophytica TaxID=1642495 RepID=UPI00197C936F|nr:helix-turn-helix transcriptional regulator [Phytoactinopolyspora endophytica]